MKPSLQTVFLRVREVVIPVNSANPLIIKKNQKARLASLGPLKIGQECFSLIKSNLSAGIKVIKLLPTCVIIKKKNKNFKYGDDS